MKAKKLKQYLEEIDRLKKLDWNTSIKINQEFKDRKEQEERNKKIEEMHNKFNNINYVSNCCGFGLDESNLICLKCSEGCEPINEEYQEETQTNNFDNRLINFINNLK